MFHDNCFLCEEREDIHADNQTLRLPVSRRVKIVRPKAAMLSHIDVSSRAGRFVTTIDLAVHLEQLVALRGLGVS